MYSLFMRSHEHAQAHISATCHEQAHDAHAKSTPSGSTYNTRPRIPRTRRHNPRHPCVVQVSSDFRTTTWTANPSPQQPGANTQLQPTPPPPAPASGASTDRSDAAQPSEPAHAAPTRLGSPPASAAGSAAHSSAPAPPGSQVDDWGFPTSPHASAQPAPPTASPSTRSGAHAGQAPAVPTGPPPSEDNVDGWGLPTSTQGSAQPTPPSAAASAGPDGAASRGADTETDAPLPPPPPPSAQVDAWGFPTSPSSGASASAGSSSGSGGSDTAPLVPRAGSSPETDAWGFPAGTHTPSGTAGNTPTQRRAGRRLLQTPTAATTGAGSPANAAPTTAPAPPTVVDIATVVLRAVEDDDAQSQNFVDGETTLLYDPQRAAVTFAVRGAEVFTGANVATGTALVLDGIALWAHYFPFAELWDGLLRRYTDLDEQSMLCFANTCAPCRTACLLSCTASALQLARAAALAMYDIARCIYPRQLLLVGKRCDPDKKHHVSSCCCRAFYMRDCAGFKEQHELYCCRDSPSGPGCRFTGAAAALGSWGETNTERLSPLQCFETVLADEAAMFSPTDSNASSGTSATASGTVAPNDASTAPASADAKVSAPYRGLSTAEVLAIMFAVCVPLLAAAVCAAFVLRSRRRRRAEWDAAGGDFDKKSLRLTPAACCGRADSDTGSRAGAPSSLNVDELSDAASSTSVGSPSDGALPALTKALPTRNTARIAAMRKHVIALAAARHTLDGRFVLNPSAAAGGGGRRVEDEESGVAVAARDSHEGTECVAHFRADAATFERERLVLANPKLAKVCRALVAAAPRVGAAAAVVDGITVPPAIVTQQGQNLREWTTTAPGHLYYIDALSQVC